MIVYQIDKSSLRQLNASIKELSPVLAEISPTLQTLLEVVNQHAAAISTPTVNEFRNELIEVIQKAIGLTRATTEDIHKLVSVSDQAGKHLAAIEEHFGGVLRGTQKEDVVEANALQV
jgi:hypothetical protein